MNTVLEVRNTSAHADPRELTGLWLSGASPTSPQPVTVGIPFPMGRLFEAERVCLLDAQGQPVLTQATALARWSDGSIQWLLLDFLVDARHPLPSRWTLTRDDEITVTQPKWNIDRKDGEIAFSTGTLSASLPRRGPLKVVLTTGANANSRSILGAQWEGIDGEIRSLIVEDVITERHGAVRCDILAKGHVERRRALRFRLRLSFFPGTSLMKAELALRNTQPARHPGGLWDLGDPGSISFCDLSLVLSTPSIQSARITCERDSEPISLDGHRWSLFQGSSGGENEFSVNHVNREGRVPIPRSGYCLSAEGETREGKRATPTVVLNGSDGQWSVAVPDFWRQFPKRLSQEKSDLLIGLFPREFGDPFELQGGEQKTHVVVFERGNPGDGDRLAWVHDPVVVRAEPDWYARSRAIPYWEPIDSERSPDFERYVAELSDPQTGLLARREIIDEFGWRNFGDVLADHEREHYKGSAPFVSHYNNQFDQVLGFWLEHLRTGAIEWKQLAEPLARHVIDIDIYHTRKDKAAYNGGLFWFTDHYLTAHTSTHRTYSRENAPPAGPYGGGPSAHHCYTTGLLLHYYLTGELAARDAVIELARWIADADHGSSTMMWLLDDGPTGITSYTADPLYHGPGRGAGNAINALLDGYLASGDPWFLNEAERFLRRSISAADDVAARGFDDIEMRWSYTMHLSAIDRYLEIKQREGMLDRAYSAARAALVHYAEWMLEHERPYFDQRDKLEYPTEAWAGQEMRKANVLRRAARHVDDPTLSRRMLARGQELADRAWSDLWGFSTRATARAAAMILLEGLRDAAYRSNPERAVSAAGPSFTPTTEEFTPQKQRVKQLLRRPWSLATALLPWKLLKRWSRRRDFIRRHRCCDW